MRRAARGARRLWAAVVVALVIGCGPKQELASLGDLVLESGEILRDCRIGYRTFGSLDGSRSNAVLVTPWAMGTSADLAHEIGRGRMIDSSRFFVIAVDALGNGVSSSPSNSAAQPGTAFPKFTMRDLVETQRRLLEGKLHVDHLAAVVGTSMGGMQAFHLITAHPTFVDRAVAIAGTPRSLPEERRRWGAWRDDLGVPRWRRALRALGAAEPRDALRELGVNEQDRGWQAEAIAGHDVTKPFGGSLERAAAAVRAKVLIVVSKRDEVVSPAPAREFAALLGADLIELDGTCGHRATVCERATLRAAVADFLRN